MKRACDGIRRGQGGKYDPKEIYYYGHVRGRAPRRKDGRDHVAQGCPAGHRWTESKHANAVSGQLFGLDRSARSRGHTTPGNQQKAFGFSFFDVGEASLVVRRLRESTAPQLATESSHPVGLFVNGRFWVEEEEEGVVGDL